VNLTAEPGECVIIRGPSGAGKSTIAKLLVGQLTPTHGVVLVDGVPPAGVLHGVGAVLQSDRLIGGSIRDNILLYRRKFDDAALMAALDIASLAGFVRKLPMALSTPIGEGIGGLAKSGESLLFVTLAAWFMGAGNFTVGGFVALGAYNQLLASAMGSLFQLHLRRQQMEVHRLQAADLLTADQGFRPPSRTIDRGDVRLADVSFAYGSLEQPVLTGVNLTAEPGECVIIRGPSGAGKSTIAKLLVGQLTPTHGVVLVDGVPPACVLHGVGAVLQSDRLIGGSIRDNILLYRRKFDDAALMAALDIASLSGFVRKLPMALSTPIGEGIGGLSGGQRQRLLIARAALGQPRLIILDEATSSLEVEVESRILRTLKATGATVILIAHRPEVWALADRIYDLDESGRLAEVPLPPRPKAVTNRHASSATA
jgi:ABC-type bacteriocin/lantibiotic exporter with double-glycine peptidase domain